MIHQYGFCQCQIIDTQSWRHHHIHKRFAFSEGNNRAGGRRTMLNFLGVFRIQALVLHRCCFVIILNDMEVHVFVTHSLVVPWQAVKCLHVTKVLLDGWLWWRALIDGRWKGYVTGFELQHSDVWPDLICVDWHGSSALEEPRHRNAQEHIEVFQNAFWSR